VPQFTIKEEGDLDLSFEEILGETPDRKSDYSLLEILKSETLFKNTNQRKAVMRPS